MHLRDYAYSQHSKSQPKGAAVLTDPGIPARELEAMVREHLQQGSLPILINPYVKAGYGGVGEKCEVCGREIRQHDAEYEVPNLNGHPFLFHLRCHHAWQAECARLQAKKSDEIAAGKPATHNHLQRLGSRLTGERD